MHSELNEIIKYKHFAVINRFRKEYPSLESQAEQIFTDLMIFFWGSEKQYQEKIKFPNNKELDFLFIMDEVMKPIDLMWHIFLLYTKDYMEFCEQYFGKYIHHLPDLVPVMQQDKELFRINLERFLNFVYDNLGEQTLKRWFSDLNLAEVEKQYLEEVG